MYHVTESCSHKPNRITKNQSGFFSKKERIVSCLDSLLLLLLPSLSHRRFRRDLHIREIENRDVCIEIRLLNITIIYIYYI